LCVHVENQKRNKRPGNDKIPTELTARGGKKKFVLRSVHVLVFFGIRKNYLNSGRSQPMNLVIWRAIKQIVVIIEANNSHKQQTQFMKNLAVKFRSIYKVVGDP
jgi:hypothetical protein